MNTTQPEGTHRRRRYLLAAALPAFLVAALLTVVFREYSGVAEIPLAAALQICEQDGGYDLDCAQTVVSSRDVAPASEAQELLALVRTSPALSESCHSLMHMLGQRMPISQILDVGSIAADNLSQVWGSCGYGFLHGVFESLPLPETTAEAGALVGRACDQPSIVSEDRLYGECFHALGHAVHDAFTNIDERKSVCLNAFPSDAPGMSAGRIGCYTGLAMKVRDELLGEIARGRAIPATAEAFARAGSHCQSADPEWGDACAPGFVQVATESGPDHLPLFLDWCASLTSDQGPCFSQAGVYMGHYLAKFSSIDSVVTLCDGPGGRYPARLGDLCRMSLVEGRMNTGMPAAEAVDLVCAALRSRDTGVQVCEAARARYLA